MGLIGDMLVFITTEQEGLVNKNKFDRMIRAFLDYAVWKLSTYIYFNNGFDVIERHAKALEAKYPLVADFLHKSAVRDWGLDENLNLSEAMQVLKKRGMQEWVMPDAEALLKELLYGTDNPVLLADKILHFQHTTGNLFDEDIREERDYAERTIGRILYGE